MQEKAFINYPKFAKDQNCFCSQDILISNLKPKILLNISVLGDAQGNSEQS